MDHQTQRYLKGPVSWNWLSRAGALKGRALHTGLALLFMAGIKRNSEVALPLGQLKEMGVDRHAAYRGLKQLESAGLVAVRRAPGRKTSVQLLGHEVQLTARRISPGALRKQADLGNSKECYGNEG